jgi:predicted secreted protein
VTPPTTVSLRVGEKETIRLAGRAAAGYTWTVAVSPADDAAVDVSDAAAGADDAGPPGATRDHAFVLSARRPGRAVVHFEQRRPWERDAEPLEAHDVEVVVEP